MIKAGEDMKMIMMMAGMVTRRMIIMRLAGTAMATSKLQHPLLDRAMSKLQCPVLDRKA